MGQAFEGDWMENVKWKHKAAEGRGPIPTPSTPMAGSSGQRKGSLFLLCMVPQEDSGGVLGGAWRFPNPFPLFCPLFYLNLPLTFCARAHTHTPTHPILSFRPQFLRPIS